MRYNPETGELRLDENGHEIPDPTPMAPPIGYKRQPSLAEQIRAMVRSEKLRQEAEEAGAETFDEADDFDVGDDYDPRSPYEHDFDPGVEADPPSFPAPTPASAAGDQPAAPVSDGSAVRSGETPPPASSTPKQ